MKLHLQEKLKRFTGKGEKVVSQQRNLPLEGNRTEKTPGKSRKCNSIYFYTILSFKSGLVAEMFGQSVF